MLLLNVKKAQVENGYALGKGPGLVVSARNEAIFVIKKITYQCRGVNIVPSWEMGCPNDHSRYAASLLHVYELGIEAMSRYIAVMLLEDPNPLANPDLYADTLEIFLQETRSENKGPQMADSSGCSASSIVAKARRQSDQSTWPFATPKLEHNDMFLRWHGKQTQCGDLRQCEQTWRDVGHPWRNSVLVSSVGNERRWPIKEQALADLIKYSAPEIGAALLAIHPQDG